MLLSVRSRSAKSGHSLLIGVECRPLHWPHGSAPNLQEKKSYEVTPNARNAEKVNRSAENYRKSLDRFTARQAAELASPQRAQRERQMGRDADTKRSKLADQHRGELKKLDAANQKQLQTHTNTGRKLMKEGQKADKKLAKAASKAEKAKKCEDGACVDFFEDYPTPFPPAQ